MTRWKTMAGSAFAALIMGIVLYFYGGDLRNVNLDPIIWSALAGSVAVYVLVMMLGATGWKLLLQAFDVTLGRAIAERQFLISQLGKYIPGNVAQYLGRAAMAIKTGAPAAVVGVAMITETVAIAVGGFLAVGISLVAAPDLIDSVKDVVPDRSGFIWLCVALAAVLTLLFGATLASKAFRRLHGIPRLNFGGLVKATLLYALSFLLLGMSLHLIAASISPVAPPPTLSIAVFAVGWVAGLATPGAPGGLGVREAVITLGLAPVLGGSAALSAALLHRGVSVLGDVISFGIGLILPEKAPISSISETIR